MFDKDVNIDKKQKSLIDSYRILHPEYAKFSDAEILSVMNTTLDSVKINEDEKISAFWNSQNDDFIPTGIEFNKTQNKNAQNKDLIFKAKNGKIHNLNKAFKNRIKKSEKTLQKAEEENGFIGKMWSGFKNMTGIGDSSDKVRELHKQEKNLLNQFNSNPKKRANIFKELTGEEYTKENLSKFIEGEIKLQSELALQGYTEGQDMASDIAGDIVSGIAAMGLYSAAVAAVPVTGGLSLAAATITGAGAAILGGSTIKMGLKYADAKSGNREYNSSQRDAVTGAFSGILAPVTAGLGGAIGKTVATKLGIEVFKQGAKGINIGTNAGVRLGLKPLTSVSPIFKKGIKEKVKSVLLNPAGYSYGGTLGKQIMAYGTEMASDGALGGAIDTSFRTAYDGGEIDDILLAGLEGGIGGFFLAPVIGGGMKGAGKAGHLLGNKYKEFNYRNDAVKELTKFEHQKTGITTSVNKQLLKTAKNSNIKQSQNIFKLFKQSTKQLFAKEGKPRFKPDEFNKFLSEIKNPFLKENPELAENILKEIAEMRVKSHYKGFDDFYRFGDNELTDILKLVNEKNFDIFQQMLRSKNKEYTYNDSSFAEILKLYSAYDSEISLKVIKMLETNRYFANEVNYLSQFLKLVKQYPDEMNFITYDFHPKQVEKIFPVNLEVTTAFIKRIQNCTPEERELIEVLLSPKNTGGQAEIGMLLKILDSDIGLNNKQIITYLKTTDSFDSTTIDKVLEHFSEIKDKKFEYGKKSVYKKDKPMTKQDMFNYVRALGVSEEECKIFCEFEIAEPVIKLLDLDDISEGMIFGGANKVQIIKSLTIFFESGVNNENVQLISMLHSIVGYINKENFEIYKLNNKNANFGNFMNDLNIEITNTECQSICSTVRKLTGKDVYYKDLRTINVNIMKVMNLTEEEITASIKKLNELNLIKDDSNIITLLVYSKELQNIKITPELREFAQYLSNNKFIEEGSVIDILSSVQAINNQMTKTKISFAKELIENMNINQGNVPNIIKNLSENNSELLAKQLKFLKNIENKYADEMVVLSKMIKSETLEEFKIYENLFNCLNKSENINTDLLYSIVNFDDTATKLELADFAVKLLNKNFREIDISSVLHTVQMLNIDKKHEFISLYLKGIDADLGSLKDIYEDIILLQISDAKHLNLKDRLSLYDKLSSINNKEQEVLKQIGYNYKSLLDTIINTIGLKRQIISMNPEQNQLFIKHFIANNNSKAEKILQNFDFSQFGKDGLPLKYARSSFNSNVEAIIKSLPQNEVEIILQHFGLVRGAAGFDGLPNNAVFKNETISKEGIAAAGKIQKEIEKFVLNNEVMISDKETKEVLDGLVKGFPEFTSIIGKKQHGTHDYSIDIHTLKVLQSAMNNPLYKTLNDKDKTILKYSILLHDLGKKGGIRDEGHASLSADYCWSILDRYTFPAGVKDRIIDIVDNHHWFEKYNTGNATAENIAVRCRRPEDLKIYEIFAKSDLENVNSTFHFERTGTKSPEEFNLFMQNKYLPVEKAVNKIYENANFIFDSQFIHRGKLFPTTEIEINGKKETFRVLDFSKLAEGENLEKYGFAPEVTRDNARFVVHMTDPDFSSLETVFRLTETPVFQSTWSSSLVQMSNNYTYWGKNIGVIFDIPQANYSEAFWGNSHTGNEKGLDAFQNFLFKSRKIKKEDINGKTKTWDVRHYVKDNFIEEMIKMGYNLTETEYATLSKYLFGKKYLSQIRQDIQLGEKIISAKDLKTALEKSRDALFYGNEHSEIVPINPKVKGIFAKTANLKDCPEEVLRFAQEHDLPIILMKPVDKKSGNVDKNFVNAALNATKQTK